ncbi:acetyl-CoA acetyltransferase, cytosolic [Sitophilus oryzae]|uniref:Acetyl-CoA acetyltransferase, cytosolic n=1 Tax=Sitophilus oryzae TaxID=7048 RepID=A0A6J2XCR0_SITOR|nr:acetyl-CoA acetyltransferase, cytosolic [Sitophilus oryzae]XP_030748580.1 acetyl-CoA acetyltransferase, cytosolic [Sitophilus oryzae]
MSKVFVISGCRTAIGSFQGQFEKYPASELGTLVIAEAISRSKIKSEDVEQCIMGQVLTAGQGQNPARQAAIRANIPNSSPAYTINMLCGSGLKSVVLGYQALKNEDYNILVVGGQESMTRAQHSTYLRGNKLGALNLCDTLLNDGLTDAFNNFHMGNTAEHLAKTYNISRADQDAFSVKSQNKAEIAIKNGYFDEEIVGVLDKRTKKSIDKDEFPKQDCNLEKLAKLRPVFEANGTVTAGNASGINDGAAAVVLANEHSVKEKQLKPLAEIIAFAEVGVDPVCMGLGPIRAILKVLEKAGWTKDEVDLYELNEAFAVQSIICLKELGLEESKVNISGGAIALGHPIGASGTRCLVTLIYNLRRLKKKRGIVALCIGGGMGIAMAIEIA